MRSDTPSTKSPRTALKRQNAQTLANENLRVWLLNAARDIDGALFFDNNQEKAQRIFAALKQKLKWSDFSVTKENRAACTDLLKYILMHVDWSGHSASYNVCALRNLVSDRCLSPLDVVDIVVARSASKSAVNFHDYLSYEMAQKYNLRLAQKLYEEGAPQEKAFAVLYLGQGVENYFSSRQWMQDDERLPPNWPGQVRAFLTNVFQTSENGAIQASAFSALNVLREQEALKIRTAIRNARAPFQP